MSQRVKPDPGQQCECPSHDARQPSKKLRRVYGHKRGKFCYEWWCPDCFGTVAEEEMEDGWPIGSDGRFATPVHCPTIPGLD